MSFAKLQFAAKNRYSYIDILNVNALLIGNINLMTTLIGDRPFVDN